MSTRPPLPADQLVTSSALVRHFGLWQERAARAPVYVLHRGRPRLVLTSIETMEALCAPHAADDGAPPGIDTTALLDTVSDIVLIADKNGSILASSRVARVHFGTLAQTGAPLLGIAAAAARPFLADAIRRAMALGVGDRLEIPSAAREARMLSLAIEPLRHGVVLFAQDGTSASELIDALATEHALAAAMQAATGIAAATINQRGYVTAPAPILSALTGLTPEALALIRFVALVEIGARRVALGEAIERTLAGETPPPLTATLLVNRADPLPVRIGLAPLRRAGTIEGAAAIIVAT